MLTGKYPIMVLEWFAGAHSLIAIPYIWKENQFIRIPSFNTDGTNTVINADHSIDCSFDGFLVGSLRSIKYGMKGEDRQIWEYIDNKFIEVAYYSFKYNEPEINKPKTEISFENTPNQANWRNKDTKITIVANDDTGIYSLFINIIGNKTIIGSIVPKIEYNYVFSEGKWVIRYYATDLNIETQHEIEIYIDETPPVINYQIVGTEISKIIYKPGVAINIDANDPWLFDGSYSSQVNRIEYSLDNGNSWRITITKVLYFNDIGNYNLKIRAIDNADNQSEEKSIPLIIQK